MNYNRCTPSSVSTPTAPAFASKLCQSLIHRLHTFTTARLFRQREVEPHSMSLICPSIHSWDIQELRHVGHLSCRQQPTKQHHQAHLRPRLCKPDGDESQSQLAPFDEEIVQIRIPNYSC